VEDGSVAADQRTVEARLSALERAVVAMVGEVAEAEQPGPPDAASFARTALSSLLDALDGESLAALVDPYLDECDSYPEAVLRALRALVTEDPS
jgi:hypothetical protein